MSIAKRWCFTLNNPTEDEQFDLALYGEEIAISSESPFRYLVFGRETGESGTPHLQGYFILTEKKRLGWIKGLTPFIRAHLEVARGSFERASAYCKKEGDFDEYGDPPSPPGNGAQFEQLRDWIAAQPTAPTIRDVWEVFPTLAARYRSACLEAIALFGARPRLVEGQPRLWQHRLNGIVDADPDDRRIVFVVDPEGNNGKSWWCRYQLSNRDDAQFMSVGKRDDLAFAVDVNTTLFIFDIPRGHMQYLQYSILEQLKNRMVFSNKYCSQTKILTSVPHVVVLSNEHPDMEALTNDRYKIIEI